MASRLQIVLLAVLMSACGCRPAGLTGDVVVFVLDSPMHEGFVRGQDVAGGPVPATHGSLVGRVVRGYCRAPIESVPVAGLGGGISRALYLDGLRAVLRYAEAHPTERLVVNISLGSPAPDPEEAELIRRLAARGALVVAAAGNGGAEELDYPAGYPEVVAVAAATPRGKAASSNYGASVDIAADGDVTFMDYEFLPYEWLRQKTEAEGTSFAAPRVAATVAYLLRRDPALMPRAAFDVVRGTARPVDDDYYRRGLLGAGVLDVRRARAAVDPFYGLVHYVLPVCTWVLLAVASVYLCMRHGLVGLFLTLMGWVVILPASVLLVIETGRWLEFVGAGSRIVGLGATGVFAATVALAAMVQRWQVRKAFVAAVAPFVVFLIWGASRPAGGEIILGALGAGAAGVCLAAIMEARAQRLLRAIRSASPGGEDWRSVQLIDVRRRALDRRIQEAAVRALGAVGDVRAGEFLLAERRHAGAAADALARIARERLESVLPLLARFGGLSDVERDRLLTALERAASPGALPYLDGLVAPDGSGRVRRLIERLRGEAGA